MSPCAAAETRHARFLAQLFALLLAATAQTHTSIFATRECSCTGSFAVGLVAELIWIDLDSEPSSV
eukprot:2907945-Rhodomonas_salina.2